MNHRQLQVIEYLQEENRVLREQLGQRRLRLSDDQRRRLAARAKGLGRKLLREVAHHRDTGDVAEMASATHCPEYEGNGKRGSGRPVWSKIGTHSNSGAWLDSGHTAIPFSGGYTVLPNRSAQLGSVGD